MLCIKNQGAGTNFQQKLGQIEKEAAMQGNGTKSNSIITTENFSISTVDLPGYSSQTSSTSSLPQDISLMKNLEKIYLMRKSRIEGATLANNVNPERVNLFEDLNSSLTLAKQSNPKYEEQRVDNANNNNNSHDVGEDDSSSSDNEYCDALEEFDIEDTLNLPPPQIHSSAQSVLSSIETSPSLAQNASDNHLHVSTIDEYIHSGVQLCFGILQVVLSLIPPAIGKVLSIVGFRGDREVGLRLLWRTAITCRNVHGELALLFILVFYDGPVQFVDNGFRLPDQGNDKRSSHWITKQLFRKQSWI